MKLKIVLFSGLFILLSACHKDKDTILEIPSGSDYSCDCKEQIIKITIQSNSDWQLLGAENWLEAEKSNGSGDDTLRLKVSANIAFRKRTANLLLKSQQLSRTFHLTQSAATEEYHYQLPLIFHILYNDPTNPKENVAKERIYQIIDECNAIYSNTTSRSVDMNLELVAAPLDPEGNLMPEPGIERIKWTTSVAMDCNKFMEDKNMAPYLWDPDKYINVFIYTFTNKDVLGISYLPYYIPGNRLEGLKNGSWFLTHSWYYPHCISMNNSYLLTQHPVLQIPDATITLSHELGHYLGLFHVFTSEADDPDYCDDTETYNRDKYEEWLMKLESPLPFSQLVRRTSLQGKEFISYNLMDYDYSYLNQFTPDQRKRVRHVLENCPFIPGPKIPSFKTKADSNEEKPTPRYIQ